VRAWIEEKYPLVFEPSEEVEAAGSPRWDKLIINLCKGDITKVDAVSETLMHTVFTEMESELLAHKKSIT